ncbi:MAG: type VI secretion system tube protein Hcp [Myxococcales bacterium]|nr:type VI secretion system tube protein Hcp [Myxococcales bacterium]MCB9700904.1 type VI secretion system tube protein Hcp [Myxococcales bacterium]
MENTYIKFAGVTGGAKAKGLEGWCEAVRWGYGCNQPTSAVAGTVKPPKHSPLTFVKYVDVASDELLKALWAGKPLANVELRCFRESGEPSASPVLYLRIFLEHVIVKDYSVEGDGGDLSRETIALDFRKITWEYTDGPTKHVASHDLVQNVVA